MSDHVSRQVAMGRYLLRREGFHFQPPVTIGHWCPACREIHDYAVDAPYANGAKWGFDGNLEAPSFTPSMNIAWGLGDKGVERCHYFVRRGVAGRGEDTNRSYIDYCGDSTHALSGKSILLPEIPVECGRWTPIEGAPPPAAPPAPKVNFYGPFE